MLSQMRAALILLAVFTGLTGLAYPVLVTGLAQVMLPYEANGSLIVDHGRVVGSCLIAQGFTEAKYFWPRPSAASPPWNAANGAGSNQARSNPALAAAVQHRLNALRGADGGTELPAPVDLITASGSGLDPHITPAAAEYQVARVARARAMKEDDVRALVRRYTLGRDLGLLGEIRVNVLLLNLALDGKAAGSQPVLLRARGAGAE